jgi:ubiquinol-cytochrome c reductase cytochrome c subunit
MRALRTTYTISLSTIAAIFIYSCTLAQVKDSKPVKTSVEVVKDGKNLFTRDGCYECHGLQGQGSSASGPRLAPDPPAFSQFSDYVRDPKGIMPPYTEKVLSNEELAEIYAFLQSVPKPPAVENIPLLH